MGSPNDIFVCAECNNELYGAEYGDPDDYPDLYTDCGITLIPPCKTCLSKTREESVKR